MKQIAILLMVAPLVVGCQNASGGTSALDVRVMTFNVKQQNPGSQQPKDAPTHWDRRKAVVFDILRDSSPDIVGLQEPYRSQLDDIRKVFPAFGEVGEGRDGENRGEHSSILYQADRFRVDDSGTFWLSDTPDKKSKTWGHFYFRICTWARIVEKKSGRAFYVFNTHLDHQSQSAREKSVRLIAQRIHNRKHKDPFILTGDFNAGETNPVVKYLKGKDTEPSPVPVVDSFRLLHPEEKTVGTYNGFEGRVDGEKIDYIFVPSDAEVLEAAIVRTQKEGLYPSDHFPVTASIRLRAAGDGVPPDLPDPAGKPEDARSFAPPPGDELLKTLRPAHPRLLLTGEDLPRLRKTVRDHPVLSRWYASLKRSATETLAERPADYALPDGRRLSPVQRTVMERVRNLAFVYLMEGDKRYAERAWQELAHAAEYSDWNPSHFLDTAEMTHAFAIGYDWLYNYLDDGQRKTVRGALVGLGLQEGLKAYRSRLGNEEGARVGDFWVTGDNNWNQVCNGGMGTGALALADEMPELAAEVLGYVVRSLPRAMRYYAPDGAGTEGVTYWDYGTRYNVVLLASLQSALGTDFGLSGIDGFRQSGNYQIYLSGADRRTFDFGDCGLSTASTPQHFWMGKRFSEPRFSWFRATTLKTSGCDGNLLDILWYDESGGDFDPTTIPPGRHFRKAEVASFRTSWDEPNAIVLAMQGGRNVNGAHRHIDLGSFILEASGERWIADLGMERETYMGHKHGNQRWEYYRVRAEGHNTLVVNPGKGPDQPMNAEALFTLFDAASSHAKAVIDLSEACGDLVKTADRKFELIDRKRVVITDTLQAAEPVEVYWFAHTGAEASIDDNGKAAVLRQGGKHLQVRILEGPAPARFTVMAAEPLASSPKPTPQASNRDCRKLAIHLKGIEALKLTVEFVPSDR